MAKVEYKGSVTGFRGRVGNLIFRQMPNGTIVVSAAPAKLTGRQKKRAKLKRSAKQKAHNSRFKEASAYARYAAQVHPVYAELATVTPMKTAYDFALSDWFYAPVVHCIERRDGSILVEASDNVLVTKVVVTVLGADGEVLAKGEAVRCEGNWWEFTSQVEGGNMVVEAWDLPGHVTKFVLQ